jgi:hypothetical protein
MNTVTHRQPQASQAQVEAQIANQIEDQQNYEEMKKSLITHMSRSAYQEYFLHNPLAEQVDHDTETTSH